MVAGSAPRATAIGNGSTRVSRGVVAEIQRPAAVGKPAHDQLVGSDDLLSIDTEVLSRLVRPARNHQTPGDQRSGIAGPAGLYRQPAEVDLGPSQTTDWQTPVRSSFGAMSHSALFSRATLPIASRSPRGASGSRRLAKTSPTSRSAPTSVAPMASATRVGVPKRLHSTGIECPSGARTAEPARPT